MNIETNTDEGYETQLWLFIMAVKMRSSVRGWKGVAKPRLCQDFSLLDIIKGFRARGNWRQMFGEIIRPTWTL